MSLEWMQAEETLLKAVPEIVFVRWIDPTVSAGWHGLDAFEGHFCSVYAAGFLLREDEDSITLALMYDSVGTGDSEEEIDPGQTQVNGVVELPKGVIRSITRLPVPWQE